MKRILFILLASVAVAQGPKPKPELIKPVVTSKGTFYQLPADARSRIRDLQYENDQLEIENQRLRAELAQQELETMRKLTQNQQKQRTLVDQMQDAATKFANDSKLDIGSVELDPHDLVLRVKQIGPAK